jgi:hypothetical protein
MRNTMRRRGLPRVVVVAALLAVTSAIALPSVASATTAADCEAKIQSLRDQTTTVAISGQNAEIDRAGLLGKLNEASAKLEAGKSADAVLKLEDFKAKVQQLEDAGKVFPEDAARLKAGADDAIACINSMSA